MKCLHIPEIPRQMLHYHAQAKVKVHNASILVFKIALMKANQFCRLKIKV